MKNPSGRRMKKVRYEVEALEGRRLVSASMLKDINTTTAGSIPLKSANVGGIAYFPAFDGMHGRELWRSDGTQGGTSLVKEIAPGKLDASPSALTPVGSLLFFVATDDGSNDSLWKTDGTEAGTTRMKSLDPRTFDSNPNPYSLTAVGNTLFFVSSDPTHGKELWKSDGTTGGTVLVKDIASGSTGSGPGGLTDVNGTLFFAAASDSGGGEIWRSDGTEAGTTRLIGRPEGKWYVLGNFGSAGGVFYFSASDAYNSQDTNRLWRSDGTTAGTTEVTTTDGMISAFTNAGGTLYFSASPLYRNPQLYKIDPGGSCEVVAGANSSYNSPTAAIGHTLYFVDLTRHLCKTDGTSGGTVQIAYFPVIGSSNNNVDLLTTVGQTVFFAADNGINGQELWASNGTAAGTYLVKDIAAGSRGSSPAYLAAVGDKLYFSATSPANGTELWVSDGTDAGTTLTRDINTKTNSAIRRFVTQQDQPPISVALNGVLYFAADDGIHGEELWKSDGTAAGTVLVKDLIPGEAGSGIQYPTYFRGALYFGASALVGNTRVSSLWRSDGTEAGTVVVKSGVKYSRSPGPPPSSPFVPLGNSLLFLAYGPSGSELWKTDGTASGTTFISAATVGDVAYAATDHYMYFPGINGSGWDGLWKSDGTTEGTSKVPGTDSLVPDFDTVPVGIGDTYYFVADDRIHGRELWRSDGTREGTFMLVDLIPGSNSSIIYGIRGVGSTLYFSASVPGVGYGLWKSDGTEAGTVLVKTIASGSTGSPAVRLTNVDNTLYFSASGGLWRSDGTETGTVRILGVTVPLGINYEQFVSDNGVLYFAGSSASGRGLWKSDGTTAGTMKIDDIQGIGTDTRLEYFAIAGNNLFFAADDGTHGVEMWVRPLDLPPGLTATPDSVYTFTGPADHKTLAVTAGTVTLAADLSAAYPSLSITVSGTGAVAVNAPQRLAALTLDGPGASVTFGGTSDLAGLSFAGGRSLVTVPVASPTPTPTPVPPAPQGLPMLAVGDPAKAEGDAGATTLAFPVTLDRASDAVVKVYYATANVTAAHGSDYAAAGGVIVFKQGETRKTVSVQVKGDKTVEADETFRVVLYNPTGATVGNGTGVGTIRNDDAPAKPRVSVGDAAVAEGNAGTRAVTFDVALDRAAAAAVTLRYATADGTARAGSDYLAAAGALTFKPGETRKRVTVYVKSDKAREADETLFLNLSAPMNAAIADGRGRAVIQNDDR